MRDRDYINGNEPDRRRFYCPYEALEETAAGMWRPVSSESRVTELIARSVALLRDPQRFAAAIERVMVEWPISCKAEFTSTGHHVAWLGQAACCLDHGSPEALTRRAWWKLTQEERDNADRLAIEAIARWKTTVSGSQLRLPWKLSQ